MSTDLSSRRSASLWGLLLALLVSSSPAAGASISSISVSPSAPIDGELVSLGAHLAYETSGFQSYQVSLGGLGSNDFQIDIQVSSPGPGEGVADILTSEDVSTDLGPLAAGDYSYLVRLFLHPRTTTDVILADSVSGSFKVGVPEPAELAPFACLLLALGWYLGRRGEGRPEPSQQAA